MSQYGQQPQYPSYGQQPPQQYQGYPQQYRQPYQGQPQPYYPPQQFPQRAVTKQRKHTSHGLHLVLTILTGGLWGICVWLPITLWHKAGPRQKIVTRYR